MVRELLAIIDMNDKIEKLEAALRGSVVVTAELHKKLESLQNTNDVLHYGLAEMKEAAKLLSSEINRAKDMVKASSKFMEKVAGMEGMPERVVRALNETIENHKSLISDWEK